MAKTRHYRKRTTRSKRTRKHKRGGSSPPRKTTSIQGNPFGKEYKVNAHGENSAPKGPRKTTSIQGNPFGKEYKVYGEGDNR